MSEDKIQRVEEVQDIVDKMPIKGGYYVLVIVLGITFALLFFGYIIRYPQTVSGTITITMGKAPVRLVAKNSGKLRLLHHQTRQKIYENEIIALIDNPTKLSDYLVIDSLLQRFSFSQTDSLPFTFPDNLKLGDLNASYYQFINYYTQYTAYQKDNLYELQEKSYHLQLKAYQYSLDYIKQQLAIKQEEVAFYRREISRDSFRLTLGDYSERGLDKTRNNYLTVLNTWHALITDQKQLQIKMEEQKNGLARLKIEKINYENILHTNLHSSYNMLQADMQHWKNSYAFIAPFEGYLEFLEFWHENDFIISGTEVFSIIPEETPLLGQLFLPSFGAGKVKKGQEVTIKLNDYPYLEYGSLQGIVHSISMVSNSGKEISETPADWYLVLIELPEGSKTKFGSTLDLRYEIKGIADIKVEKRRLLERLFDNLKYITNQ